MKSESKIILIEKSKIVQNGTTQLFVNTEVMGEFSDE